jgi:malate synthase
MSKAASKANHLIESPAVTLRGVVEGQYSDVLSQQALSFLADLEVRFGKERKKLLKARQALQRRLNAGEQLDFLPETSEVRNMDWMITGTPADLQDRRVEITGPVDRKMMINALNSGANVFMADFEDSSAPTWTSMIEGQRNMMDYARGTLKHTDVESGKSYALSEKTAILKVRPRGLHMEDAHILIDGKAVSASLMDFGLYMFHNAALLVARGTAPYFYIPKLEHHFEARWWNEVFLYAQAALGLPVATIKATILIETITAAFQMDEILYELKDHIVGLNCGRWDYIFSFIKRVGRTDKKYLLPDRGQIIMGDAFLKAYSLLLIKTCHRRGAHAMGGMAAQLPIKGDDAANDAAFAKVAADKEREVSYGHDGTWVAHPSLVPVAKGIFDQAMRGPNQIFRKRDDVEITAEDLLRVHKGQASEAGIRENIRIALQYIGAWLNGRGAVPIYNLMEDAATAEISRTQLWQQRTLKAELDDGQIVSAELIEACIAQELEKLESDPVALGLVGDKLKAAATVFQDLIMSDDLAEFLTTPAYAELLASE